MCVILSWASNSTAAIILEFWKLESVTIIEELNMEFTEEDFSRLLFAENNRKAAEENWKLEQVG